MKYHIEYVLQQDQSQLIHFHWKKRNVYFLYRQVFLICQFGLPAQYKKITILWSKVIFIRYQQNISGKR
ncbi:MAG: hypothetical protein EBX44_15855 [Betaproteobacteria bacterium]|nr:hypothetical protein [Betaproteobacteria bacterium]NDG83250.1 hypothetical protein [Betaproteobacteria bacterium]